MKIAYVCADRGVPAFGRKGCSIHIQEVLRAMRNNGAYPTLFVTRRGDFTPPDLSSIPVQTLPGYKGKNYATREIEAIKANRALKNILKQQEPFDLIYERYSLWSFAAMAYARDLGIPGVLEVNAPLIEEQATHRELIYPEMAKKVAKKAFQAASQLIAVSKEVAEYLSEFVEDQAKIMTVTNGVDPNRYLQRSQPGLSSKEGYFTIGFVGTLKPWHGVDILLQAFKNFNRKCFRSRLLIVGDGPERKSLEREVIECELKNSVKFTGAVDHQHIPQLLNLMDVAVAPYPKSIEFYFSPLKIFEYMAAGLPVIASDIGQIPDIIEHDKNGLLLPPGDEEALEGAIHKLWQMPELRSRLGRSARTSASKNHSWNIKVKDILRVALSKSIANVKRGGVS